MEKIKEKLEWNDLRAFIQVINVILIMVYGLSIAWFGLGVAVLGIVKDFTEPRDRFRWNSVIMHLSSVAVSYTHLRAHET